MKKEIPMPLIIGVIVIIALGIIGYGYTVLNPPQPTRPGATGPGPAIGGGAGASNPGTKTRVSTPLE